MKTCLTEVEKKLAANYEGHRRELAAAFAQGRQLTQTGKWAELDAHVQQTIVPGVTAAAETMGALMGLQAALSGWRLIRTILVPLGEAGELAGRIAVRSGDEVGRMVKSLQEMQDKLLGVVRRVQEATGTISGAAREISSGNQNLSQRTEQQAASLEETASAMDQMTSTVRQNSDSARHANQLAEGTRQQAETGGKVVRDAIGAMQEVSEASRKITAIIGVIDEIAFRTNLLALNAAAEEMESQARSLEEMMTFFRVDDAPAAHAAGIPPVVRAAPVEHAAPAPAPRPRAAPAPARTRRAAAARPAPPAEEAGDWEEF